MIKIKRLHTSDADFGSKLSTLTAWQQVSDEQVEATVNSILADVRQRGDQALLEYTQNLDRLQIDQPADFIVSAEKIDKATNAISREQKEALEFAAGRIRRFHEIQLEICETNKSIWCESELDVLGQKTTPIERVGIYVPGGKAAYPSTVLMTAIPARVAGVSEIIMTVPAPNGELSDLVLAAAAIAGVDRVITIGGAQAIAALAYGTETVPGVDKIVGPGNIYVATAKQKVFGKVAIDMVAGPSEITIIADGSTNPEWVAMDLLSQAEHDELAQAICISPDSDYLDAIEAAICKVLPTLERSEIAKTALRDRGIFIQVDSLEQAVEVSNTISPEHLELSVADPDALLDDVKNAGAIFMGAYTSEALGDYVAGPSHVLPTSTTARFSSPLGVYDFRKRSSIIRCTEKGADKLGRQASVLARGESLTAHARSAELRLKD